MPPKKGGDKSAGAAEAAAETSHSTVAQEYVGLDSTNTSMGLVEILEPHDRAYFTAFLVDIHESGQKNLVRSVCDCARRVEWRAASQRTLRASDDGRPAGAGASLFEGSERGLYAIRTCFPLLSAAAVPMDRDGRGAATGEAMRLCV
jgi:hypothetical protein